MGDARTRLVAGVGVALFLLSIMSPNALLDGGIKPRENVEGNCIVCISEVMPNADGADSGYYPQGEWIELFNTGSEAVSLEGWSIVDYGGWNHPINNQSWVYFDDLNSPFMIEPGEYVIIAENEIGTLRLNNAGETIYLKDTNNATVHTVVTGSAANGVAKIVNPNDSQSEWIRNGSATLESCCPSLRRWSLYPWRVDWC